MSEWLCPGCNGGFPNPERDADGDKRCPWCGQILKDLSNTKFTHDGDVIDV